MPYIMAYDIRPLDTLKEKDRLLNEAADGAFGLYFEHDPYLEQGRVERDPSGNFSLI